MLKRRAMAGGVLIVHPLASEMPPLCEEEEQCILGAPSDRIKEFAAGRAAAREALEFLGIPKAAILMGHGGEPLWPPEVCGSISHTRSHVVVLVAPRSASDAVGVDINDRRPLGPRASQEVTWNREVALLQALNLCKSVEAARNLAFSAKEAIYKCQYPLTGYGSLGFKQVRLIPPTKEGALGVVGWRVPNTVGVILGRIEVSVVELNRQTIACAVCPPPK